MIPAAVLFDMDGTLIDSEPYWLAAETELMSRFGYAWTQEDQATCLGGPLDRVGRYMSELAGEVEDWQFFTNSLVEGVTSKFLNGLTFVPGAREMLLEIKEREIPLALVSASPRVLVDAALALAPKNIFLTSVSNNEVTRSKPDPEGYLLAATLLGVDIEDCLVLEDSKTGVSAGLASGAHVLAIPHLVEISPDPHLRILPTLKDRNFDDVLLLFSDSPSFGRSMQ